jgi:hypothetical protein
LITGVGFTVTLIEKGVPAQVAKEGVMVKVAVPGVDVVANKVWPIELPDPPVAPEVPTWDAVQLKVVPITLLLSESAVLFPEQMVVTPV